MPKANHSETIPVGSTEGSDLTVELASYLEILGSTIRLKILKIIEKQPLDVESISHELYKNQIVCSRENIERHLKKLFNTGLVRKEPGEKNGRAVMNYLIVPGAIENALRTTKKVLKLDLSIDLKTEAAKVQKNLDEEFCTPKVKVLGGIDDGKYFPLKKSSINIGRVDPDNSDKYDAANDILLSEKYSTVSRVWKPQALITFEQGSWYVEHGDAVNPTLLWDKKLVKGRKEKLKDEDIIHLSGDKTVRLLFLLPKCQPPEDQ
ncbi:MAG: ArsR family transcriptional regulator [Candidatus Bathyarchaeota archaeon]|nr:ArsR family transcriptional regulator [Candidatus Bathyarchaeota archaeon]